MKIVSIPFCLVLLFSLNSLSFAEEAEKEDASVTPAAASDIENSEQNAEPEVLPLPLDELRKFTEVFGRIKNDYVEEVDDKTLLTNAIKGMLSGLDPHSAYLEPVAYEELQENTSGSFGGLGIEVGMENGFVKVIAPIDDTPAEQAGIESGDLIVRLDDTPVKGMTLEDAINIMRGEPGTSIRLTIVRSGREGPFEMTITRAVIQVTSVKTLNLDDDYGYIRITQFQAQTGDDFKKGLDKIKESTPELKGLIIDLRNNPGGVLQAAVDVADLLLDDGLIVYTEGRTTSSKLSFSATPGKELEDLPIVTLINGGSASASEILAGALQDHDRSVVMGTQSFGKGSVQNVLPLNEEYAVKLTTARYFTPKGRSIQALGIEPDIEVNRARLSDQQEAERFKEADLAGHLDNGKEQADEPETPVDEENSEIRSRLERDYQLQEALNLLKAIHILKLNKD